MQKKLLSKDLAILVNLCHQLKYLNICHKKLIIASDLPVIREVLNEKNSILVNHDNIDLWIKSLKNLKYLKNKDRLSEQALIDFKKFTWKNRAHLVI